MFTNRHLRIVLTSRGRLSRELHINGITVHAVHRTSARKIDRNKRRSRIMWLTLKISILLYGQMNLICLICRSCDAREDGKENLREWPSYPHVKVFLLFSLDRINMR